MSFVFASLLCNQDQRIRWLTVQWSSVIYRLVEIIAQVWVCEVGTFCFEVSAFKQVLNLIQTLNSSYRSWILNKTWKNHGILEKKSMEKIYKTWKNGGGGTKPLPTLRFGGPNVQFKIVFQKKPLYLLPPANEVWGKVTCLQACVCPRGVCAWSRGGCMVPGGWHGAGGVPGGDPPDGYCCGNALLLECILVSQKISSLPSLGINIIFSIFLASLFLAFTPYCISFDIYFSCVQTCAKREQSYVQW